MVGCLPESRSLTLATKTSLSVVAEPGLVLIGVPVPDDEAWKAMRLLLGDQAAELPRVRSVCDEPSVFIKNRSDVNGDSPSARLRLLSKTIFLPLGDRLAKTSSSVLFVRRRRFVSCGA